MVHVGAISVINLYNENSPTTPLQNTHSLDKYIHEYSREKRPHQSPLGVKFKFSEEQPVRFHMVRKE